MFVDLPISLDPTAALPLHRQLYDALQQAVLTGQLPPGTRLPASRVLADTLGISRNTVLSAINQLLAEGYLEGRVGDGTYVCRTLPDDFPLQINPANISLSASGSLSQRGAQLASIPVSISIGMAQPRAFRSGVPALDHFPNDLWSRIVSRCWREATPEILSYADPIGISGLREAIANYLRASRGVRCHADQVIVIAGSQQGLDLAARMLLDPGDQVWIEDPGYLGARAAFRGAGARLVPIPIDSEGLQVAEGIQQAPKARLVYVTPSHQFPMGATLSLSRRLALLEWAAQADAWIVEDDYDSEYRYAGRPLASLQGLDQQQRVIYIGTFSKVLFPGLRLGYMVVPSMLIEAFRTARALIDRHPPGIEQLVLTQFITEGHFGRHIRRMRTLYAVRQQQFIKHIRQELAGMITVEPANSGMSLIGWLPPGSHDRNIAEQISHGGVDVAPLSSYCLAASLPPGLILGYACVDRAAMVEGLRRMKMVLSART